MNRAGMTVFYWLDLCGQATAALKDNRLRTLLSVLGIAIGVLAVTSIGMVSTLGRQAIFAELETFGLRSAWISRDTRSKEAHLNTRKGTGIDRDDVALIGPTCCPSVRAVSPIVHAADGRDQLVRVRNRSTKASMQGVGVRHIDVVNDRLSQGRPFNDAEVARRRFVAVIGPDVAQELFGVSGMEAVGKAIHVGRHVFQVIGVLQRKDRGFLSSIGVGGGEENARLLIPYTTYQQMLDTREVNLLQVQAASVEVSDMAAAEVVGLLGHRHRERFEYRAEVMAQYIGTANRILEGVSLIGVVAASISLVVGGLGIMNIMSTSVLERTREIGLRKAVGARERDIRRQFLIEAVAIGLMGGGLGLALGLAANLALSGLTGQAIAMSGIDLSVALLVSIGVGLASGYYPATRASRMRPVDALRYE